jgi:hypothetical protein
MTYNSQNEPIAYNDLGSDESPTSNGREQDNPFEDPNHPTRWVHRRRMAYMSLISIFIVTGYLLGPWVTDTRVDVLSDIIEWFYFSMASIVGAYMGFASWSAVWTRKTK